MEIRPATIQDYDAVWQIFHQVIAKGDTYTFEADTPKEDLAKHWFAPYMNTYVAVDENGHVTGTYILKPNQPGRGGHVANGSYMVHPDHQGKGIGNLLCIHSLETAKGLGYKAIQFNIVVSTNTAAIKLWQKCGFEIIGTTPKAFEHRDLGLVDAHIMYQSL